MAKAVYFNKGTLKGSLVKSEIVKWEKDDGRSGEFLSMDIEAGSGNKVSATLFPSKANPKKHTEMFNQFSVGSKVEVSGNVQEREATSDAGKTSTYRSVSAFSIRPLKEDSIEVGTFILHGVVESVKQKSDSGIVTLSIDPSYEKDGKTIIRPLDFYTLEGNVDLIEDNDVVKGCNAKFKGRILNQLEFDDYGDIIGNIQMFLIEKIENVVDPSDLDTEAEDMPF